MRVERGRKRICRGKLTRSEVENEHRGPGISSAWQLRSNRSFILSDNISLLSAKVNISARARVYVKTCREKVNILLIFYFRRVSMWTSTAMRMTRNHAHSRWMRSSARSSTARRRTLNSRAASLNPRLKELNPTNISSELPLPPPPPDRRRRSAVPESRFISARISQFFSSPAGTRSLPRRLHKRVLRIAFLICR